MNRSKTAQKQVVINYDVCNPRICEYECVEACFVQRNVSENIPLFHENGKPRINRSYCESCESCLVSCPLSAIVVKTVDTKKKEPEQLIDLDLWRKSAYVLDKKQYRQFTEKKTIFARVRNDPEFRDYQTGIYANHEDIIKLNKQGYSRIELALATAAWTVHDNFQEAFKRDRFDISQHGLFDLDLDKALSDQLDVANADEMTKILKQASKAYGASLVGVSRLRPEWIYTHDLEGNEVKIPEHLNNAIVIAVEMDLLAVQTSPSMPAAFASGNSYSKMTFIQACVTEFIRLLGYDALPAGNGMALSVPLAIDAGLGQYGRSGLLITPEFGSRVRICKIFTNLPLVPDKPINFGVLEFCKVCKRCANACPSQSISRDTLPSFVGPTISNNPGVYKWYTNVEGCYSFWVKNGGDCSTCISSCPFTKDWGRKHKITRYFIKNVPKLNKLWLWLDKILGYGRQRDPEEFWDREFPQDRKV
jgi:reductive dehalogenase